MDIVSRFWEATFVSGGRIWALAGLGLSALLLTGLTLRGDTTKPLLNKSTVSS